MSNSRTPVITRSRPSASPRPTADNRLKEVFSSFIDTVYQSQAMLFWVKEASYQYYLHGPLARTELGAYRVQGLDYAYTLQGWIKALNAAFLKEDRDAGRDGYLQSGNLNRRVARDVFAYALGFYGASDYAPIGGASASIEPAYDTASPFHQFGQPLYNGNIRYIMQQNLATASGAYLHAYAYDQLMRYKAMNTYVPSAGALSAWNITSANPAPLQPNYKESAITYDRNGNLRTYQRWSANSSVMDHLTYYYDTLNYRPNRLVQVTDQVSAGSFSGDVDSQTDSRNYAYDGAGNLITDKQSGINSGIAWSPYGKPLSVSVYGGTTYHTFAYDAQQNRVHKRTTAPLSDTSTYYVHDAQGNVLAVYKKFGSTVTWQEQYLYGSSRLGSIEPGVSWTSAPAATPYFRANRTLQHGWHRYELTDHLGNVRAALNGRRTIYNPTDTAQLYYTAAIAGGADYFPFGAEMRTSTAAGAQRYRYGFNGKELDKTEFGSLNHYDYGFRVYNPGIGRFLSVDPLRGDYPWYTPYQFAGNTPIQAVDLDGLEPKSIVKLKYQITEITEYSGNPDELKGNEKPIKIETIIKAYNFNEVAIHLLNLTTKISKKALRKAEIRNAAGSGFPAYNPSKGGGGMTFPSKKEGIYQINLTNNYFEDNRYGWADFKYDTYEWLEIMAHEVGHIKDIKEIGGGQEYYFGVFLGDYAKEFLRSPNAGKAHDGAWREKRADIGQDEFMNFNDFIGRTYGAGQLIRLLDDAAKPDAEKINQISSWWKDYQKGKQ